MLALLDRIDPRWEQEANRLWRAMMLAPTLSICRALLRGECVPVSSLRPEWARRYGLIR